MKKIKIFVDGHWFDDPFQSMCTFLKGLYSYVSLKSNFEIFIAGHNTANLEKAFGNIEKINLLKYQSESKYTRLSIDIPRLIKRHKIDVAHFQYISPLTKNCREIVTIHDLLFKDFKNYFPWDYRITKNFLFSRSAKRADLVTTVSDYSLNSILKHFKVSPDRIIKVPNGISTDYFEENKEYPDIKRKYNLNDFILYVSRIEPRKNHLALVKAFCALKLWKENIKLVFIGREDIPVEDLDATLNSLPIEIRQAIIKFDKIEFSELLAFYKEARLFVYPSIAEGFGIPPLEAAAMKTKVLCSNATAMSDFTFFENDLFNPYDLEELKLKMRNKLTEDKSYSVERISRIIRNEYNWENISNDFSNSVTNRFCL